MATKLHRKAGYWAILPSPLHAPGKKRFPLEVALHEDAECPPVRNRKLWHWSQSWARWLEKQGWLRLCKRCGSLK